LENKIILFCGPSGSGKTTISQYLLKNNSNLCFSVSATTREKRDNEKDGEDYYFISKEEFEKKIANNEFIEWEEVYHGIFYGTLKSEIERIWAMNKSAIFDVEVMGGLNIKNQYGDKALAVFVMPPSIEILKERLIARKSETPDSLDKRIAKATVEMGYSNQFERKIINDNLDESCRHAQEMLDEFLAS
jgi:guanylate kinase